MTEVLLATVRVSKKPQAGQNWRCSHNFTLDNDGIDPGPQAYRWVMEGHSPNTTFGVARDWHGADEVVWGGGLTSNTYSRHRLSGDNFYIGGVFGAANDFVVHVYGREVPRLRLSVARLGRMLSRVFGTAEPSWNDEWLKSGERGEAAWSADKVRAKRIDFMGSPYRVWKPTVTADVSGVGSLLISTQTDLMVTAGPDNYALIDLNVSAEGVVTRITTKLVLANQAPVSVDQGAMIALASVNPNAAAATLIAQEVFNQAQSLISRFNNASVGIANLPSMSQHVANTVAASVQR
jgi:hypothetical protein